MVHRNLTSKVEPFTRRSSNSSEIERVAEKRVPSSARRYSAKPTMRRGSSYIGFGGCSFEPSVWEPPALPALSDACLPDSSTGSVGEQLTPSQTWTEAGSRERKPTHQRSISWHGGSKSWVEQGIVIVHRKSSCVQMGTRNERIRTSDTTLVEETEHSK